MTNIENIPEVIFDWIKITAYNKLNKEQQNLVIQFLTEKEYDELYCASQAFKSKPEAYLIDVEKSKKFLSEKFDTYHSSAKIISLPVHQFVLWHVAAALVSIMLGWYLFSFNILFHDSQKKEIVKLDTVYIQKEILSQPLLIHDTFIVYKKLEINQTKSKETFIQKNQLMQTSISTMPVMNLNELDFEMHSQRNNSMNDDSLVKKFGFVSL